MPARSGASHGFAAFGTLIVGTMLSKFVWDVLPPLGELSLLTMTVLNKQAGIDVPTSEQFAGTVVVMMGLSFVWGLIYHVSRH
jgi:hypothetical protein